MKAMNLATTALLLFGAHALAQPLTTTVRTVKNQVEKCKLDIKYAEVIDKTAAAKNINAQMQALVLQYIKEFNSLFSSCDKNLVQEYSINLNTSITYNSANWSSWDETSFGYTGGAHGFGQTKLTVFDPQGNRVRMSDILKVPQSTMLNAIRAKVIAARGDQFEQSSFLAWANRPTALTELNFSANQDGITVVFNSYEIASYSAGPTEILFPWTELRQLLKPDSAFSEALK